MNRIMLNWFMLAVGLVFSASAFNNPVNHHHRGRLHRYRNDPQPVVESNINAYDIEGEQLAQDHTVPTVPTVPTVQIVTECNVTGEWYNSLGSQLIINVEEETGHVTGEYRTAVERKPGAAGSSAGRVSGWTSNDGSHKTVVFSVLWKNGASATAWTGLCHVCQGEEIMKTTWLLTSEVDTCEDHWSSNRIGHDDFTRTDKVPGPRKHLDIHTPSDFDRIAKEFSKSALSQDRQGN